MVFAGDNLHDDKKVRTRRKPRKVIRFDEELVPKQSASQFEKVAAHSEQIQEEDDEFNTPARSKKLKKAKKKSKLHEVKTNEEAAPDQPEDTVEEEAADEEDEDDDEQVAGQPSKKKGESKRALKRKRKEQLQSDQKIKSALEMQKTCLNYLSQWKHNQVEWKYKKLCQIWLLKNFLDEAKVPQDFWDTTLAYFNGAKGNVRETLQQECLKVIEAFDTSESSEETIKVLRSRDILQNLQE